MANPPLHSPTSPHFFQPLLPGFHIHLTVPVAFFSKHIEGKNEQKTAKLRSDASDTTWEVKMDGRKLTEGWKEFATAHDLRIGDIIVFKHQGDMVFNVTPFGPSCCEIQYPQTHISDEEDDSEDDDELNTNKVLRKKNVIPKTEAGSCLSFDYCFVVQVSASNLQLDTIHIPKRAASSNVLKRECKEIIAVNKEGISWTLNLRYRESIGSYYIRGGWRSFCSENKFKVGDLLTFNLVGDGKSTPMICICPEEECLELMKERENKKRRCWVASSSSKENRFVTIVLTPYNFKSSKLILPTEFTRINGINEERKIILVDKHGVKRLTNLVEEGRQYRRKGLGKGWKVFCKANGVMKIGEAFVLELIWENMIPVLKFCYKVKNEEPICV